MSNKPSMDSPAIINAIQLWLLETHNTHDINSASLLGALRFLVLVTENEIVKDADRQLEEHIHNRGPRQ